MPKMSLAELAEKVAGRVDGDGSVEVSGVAGILEAGPGDVSFVDNPKYVAHIDKCRAAALIVHNDLQTCFRPLIRSENPYLSFTQAIELLAGSTEAFEAGIHPTAVISPQARVSAEATVMANVVIEEGAQVEAGAVLYPGVVVGAESHIGPGVLIYPNAAILAGTFIGKQSIIHSGVTLGTQPPGSAGRRLRPAVEIGEAVEVGANTTVVAGLKRPTRIGRGTKIDNLVHIDHDVEIGEDTIIVAMVTIEPEVTIGREVTLAGQAGVRRGLTVGSHCMIGARSVVVDDMPAGVVCSGIPAISHDQEKRIKAALMRLPKLYRRVQQIEEWLSGSSENRET